MCAHACVHCPTRQPCQPGVSGRNPATSGRSPAAALPPSPAGPKLDSVFFVC